LLSIAEVINATTLLIKTRGTIDPYIEIGEHIELTSFEQPFTVYAAGIVITSVSSGPDKRLITVNNPINDSVGDWICNADTPLLAVRNFTIENNCARGVVLKTRNIVMRNSVFNRTSAPAVIT
jgi:hypothetical protein